MNCSPPVSLIHGIVQVRILEVAFPPPGDLSNPGIKPACPVSPELAGGFFTTELPGKPIEEKRLFNWILIQSPLGLDFPGGSDGKASVYNGRDLLGSIPGSGRFPGEGNSNPLQYSCLENPMDGGAWCPWGLKESDTTEKLHFHFHPLVSVRDWFQDSPQIWKCRDAQVLHTKGKMIQYLHTIYTHPPEHFKSSRCCLLFSSQVISHSSKCHGLQLVRHPVLHYLPEFAQMHVHWTSEWLSNHLILCCSLLLLPSSFPSIGVFSNESALCIMGPKYWSFSFNISPSNEYSRLISFGIDWFDLLAVQGIVKSLLQQYNVKESVLQPSAFFMVQLSHPYMTTGNIIALTIQAFVSKVMPLLFFNMLFVIAFLPESKHPWILRLQSLSAVILEPRKKSITVSTFPYYLPWRDGTGCHDLLLLLFF